MKIENYVKEVKSCITKEDVERFLVEYEPQRNPNAKINGKMINMREFLTFILNNCEKVCANQIKEKIYKEWNNPGNLAEKFFKDIFQEEFKLDNKNEDKLSYKMPQIEYISNANGTALAEAMQQINEFRNNLTDKDYFNKHFWKEALKQKHFMPLFAEFLFDQKDYEKLKQFLKDNFYEEIEKKIKEEIKRDLEILSSENLEINKTSLIYTRYYTFYDFFGDDIKDTINNLGLSRFYDEGIFDNLVEKDLDELNLFLLASLVNYNFNGAFYSGDCKRTIGCILNLGDFYEEEKANEIFADKILYAMLQDLGTFYYIVGEEDWCWDFSQYKNIGKVKEFFEDEQNRYDAIQTFYDWKDNLPWSIIESCDDLENIWDEDELEGIVSNLGYDSFEEMCEENF